MSGHFISSDHDAPMLLSPNRQDWLPEKHLARFIVIAVEQLDLRRVEDSYEGRGYRGKRPLKAVLTPNRLSR